MWRHIGLQKSVTIVFSEFFFLSVVCSHPLGEDAVDLFVAGLDEVTEVCAVTEVAEFGGGEQQVGLGQVMPQVHP